MSRLTEAPEATSYSTKETIAVSSEELAVSGHEIRKVSWSERTVASPV